MIVTGDITQIDLPRGQHSGLVNVRDVLSSIPDISFVYFDSEDVVRHKLVQDIVSAYKLHGEQQQPARRQPARNADERRRGGRGSAASAD
jgi:phosphate starvation-inducible PhoH-like protein